jgi:hypothetical protein
MTRFKFNKEVHIIMPTKKKKIFQREYDSKPEVKKEPACTSGTDEAVYHGPK